MDIKLFNSLTNKKEVFKSIKPKMVSMYVCGSTVYDSPHIGNLRPVVVFDTLRRLFEYVGYKVTYVSNYTDIDDKIIKKAKEENTDEMSIANRYIKECEENIKGINALKPTYTPRVSENIEAIINYIDTLVKNNHAYVLDNDVYFKVDSVKNYGELSNINLEQLKVGARIEDTKGKKSPLDFALWKKTDTGLKWKSPWSEGRPGWHTECVVMIDNIFKQSTIDIHGGGFDLKFPHHENEIAQAKAMHDAKLANYWLHNGFVTFEDDKMSKSLGNVILAKDAIRKYGGNVVRLALISSHYRAPVKFNDDTLQMAKSELNKIQTPYAQLAVLLQRNKINLDKLEPVKIDNFVNALADDLNVSNALTILFDTLKIINNELRNKNADIKKLSNNFMMVKDMLYLLGLNLTYPVLTNEDLKLLENYEIARQNKDYQTSDKLRTILLNKKII
ncbi:MAG: cysteine--tRNA ligase [Bacilli bacterium]|nr:cysteine--tRNA ligase [Bacilli bacterium]